MVCQKWLQPPCVVCHTWLANQQYLPCHVASQFAINQDYCQDSDPKLYDLNTPKMEQ